MAPPSQSRWRTVPLSTICTFKPPKSIPRKMLTNDTEVSFVPMNDLGELEKHFQPMEVRRFAEVVKGYTYFADGDVLCAKITPCFENGKLGIARELKNGVGFGSSEFVVMRPKAELLSEFLYYYLSRDTFRESGARVMTGAVGHKRVPKEYFEDLSIPLPPLDEQKRIVAVLDQAFTALDRARAHAEANLADAEELLENGVNEIFTAPADTSKVISLAEAVHPDCKLSYGIVQPGDEVEGGLPVVRPVDLKMRILSPGGLKRISPDRAEGYARTKLVGGELLLCVRGSTGEMSVASAELAGANVTRGIVPIRFPDESVLPEFAYFQLRSRYAQDQIAAGTYGAALMQINIKDLRKLRFIVPSIEDQQEIISRAELLYERAGSLRDIYATKLTDIADLRQSLLQKAFSGQLT
ncbi:restriction endonuclease subunit S [Oleiagrimonas sp. C23AA]|uniref:restriction endonuclease subunit S n=1 Tax=Oleiagrimonas sp. C23AA TaxID=2719047 RepID=UPI001F0D3B50|nr:restriction endonuclease subunit S [Oleiagrimonas sp. C23AA]